MNTICMYTDGSAKGNPGRGGYGTIIVTVGADGCHSTEEFSAGYAYTTNNRMELMAVIAGLEKLKEPSRVTVTSDSKYLVDAFNKNWIKNWVRNGWRTSSGASVKNTDLWKKLLELQEAHTVRYIWIKGHNNHPMNERCDFLATSAADGESLLTDLGVIPFM